MTRLPTGYDVGVEGYGTYARQPNQNLSIVSEAIQNLATGGGVLAGTINNRLQREQRAEIDRIQQEEARRKFEEQNAEKIATEDLAAGKEQAVYDLPELLQKIESGDPNYIVPDGDLEPWAKGYIGTLTAGGSDDYRGGYESHAAPKLLEAALKQRETLKKTADAGSRQTIETAFGTSTDLAEMQRFAERYKEVGGDPGTLGLNVLFASADGNDPKRFDMAVEFLGGKNGRYAKDIAQQRVTLEAKQNNAQADRKAGAVNYLKALSEATKSPSSGQTYQGLIDAVENLRPLLGDSLANEEIAKARNAAEAIAKDASASEQKKAEAAQAKREAEAVSYLKALTETTKSPSSGQTYQGLYEAIENLRPIIGDSLANEELAKARNAAEKQYEDSVSTYQRESTSREFALAEIGGLTKDDHLNRNLPRTLLPVTDPNYLSPENYRTIDGRIKDAEVASESALRVQSALNGSPTVLTSDDSQEFTKALKKANVIDPLGRITNPTLLAATVAGTDFLPAGIVDTVQNGLSSSDPAIAGNSIEAAGLIGSSDPGSYSKLVSGLPEGEASIVAASALWARDGLYSTPDGRQMVAQELAVLRQRVADQKDITKEEKLRIGRALRDQYEKEIPTSRILDEELTKLAKEERNRVAYTKDPGIPILDFDPDPTLDLTGPGVMESMRRDYNEHFEKTMRTLGPKDAAKAAYAYAQGQFRQNYELVRFNNRVFPVPTANVAGGMPNHLRWGPGMEDDVKAALADPRVNLKPDDVSTFMPITLPTSKGNVSGWAVILPDGTMVRNDLGAPLLITPTPEQERRNIEAMKRKAAVEKWKEPRTTDALGYSLFTARLAGE